MVISHGYVSLPEGIYIYIYKYEIRIFSQRQRFSGPNFWMRLGDQPRDKTHNLMMAHWMQLD